MLGICVVYLVSEPEGYQLLDLSVAQLHRTTEQPFRIYGCCPNNDEPTLLRMEKHGVVIEPMPPRQRHMSHEHSMLLDQLADRAVADGCDELATFDMDSWPVYRGWDRLYGARVSQQAPVASIVRTELGDNFPFAAFTYLRRGFWAAGQSSFSTVLRASYEACAAALPSRPDETGSGILAQLHRDRQSFWRLERSNRWNIHDVMAGVYDNTIFHLGAGSRVPKFISDESTYSLNGSSLRRRFADRTNAFKRAFAVEELLNQHDAFIADLADPGSPLAPLETDPQHLPKSTVRMPLDQRRRFV